MVRPRCADELGVAVGQGVVGLGIQAGVGIDATGLTPRELIGLAKQHTGRRPAKALRQLSTFLDEVKPGDLVGVPVDEGAGLLLGEVVGDYLFAAGQPLPHRRPARFVQTVARAAARPPAALQDPRALFQLTLDPAALPPTLTWPRSRRET